MGGGKEDIGRTAKGTVLYIFEVGEAMMTIHGIGTLFPKRQTNRKG